MSPSLRKRMFWVWCDMRARCESPNHKAYANYGGRGIAVCDRWQIFDWFVDDMGERPDGASLDRINNDGGYAPDNCRWATRKEQNSNRRNCILIADGEETVTLREYCRRRNLPYRTIVKRYKNRHWTLEDAVSIPVGSVPTGPKPRLAA